MLNTSWIATPAVLLAGAALGYWAAKSEQSLSSVRAETSPPTQTIEIKFPSEPVTQPVRQLIQLSPSEMCCFDDFSRGDLPAPADHNPVAATSPEAANEQVEQPEPTN